MAQSAASLTNRVTFEWSKLLRISGRPNSSFIPGHNEKRGSKSPKVEDQAKSSSVKIQKKREGALAHGPSCIIAVTRTRTSKAAVMNGGRRGGKQRFLNQCSTGTSGKRGMMEAWRIRKASLPVKTA